MTISSLLLRIVFLAMPGVIARLVYRKLVRPIQQKYWEFVCEITLFSFLCYGLYATGAWLVGWLCKCSITVRFFEAIFNEDKDIPWHEIAIASALSIVWGFVGAFAYTRKWLNRFGRRIGATKRYGDDDVWDYFHSSPDIEWLYVRDQRTKLTYYGWIAVFSETEQEREVIMRDVQVFSSEVETAEPIYTAEVMYLCRDKYDLTLEVPKLPETVADNDGNDEEGR